MNLSKTMLTGVALCALATAPALAERAPHVRLAGISHSRSGLNVHMTNHSKTNIQDPKKTYYNYTYTITWSVSGSETGLLGNTVNLPAETWYDPSTCTQPSEKGKVTTKPVNGKSKSYTTTGNISGCGSVAFNFYGPTYDLKNRNATSDYLRYDVLAKHTSSGYNLDLLENFDITIT